MVPTWLEERFPTLDQVHGLLAMVFPEGMTRRPWLTNLNAARTVSVMLYSLAIEGTDRWIALPDVLLADIAPPLRFVAVEAVATEGPVDATRVTAVTGWLGRSGFPAQDAYFITAYLDRGEPAFRKTVGEVAWRTALWFVTKPECLLVALDGSGVGDLRGLPGW